MGSTTPSRARTSKAVNSQRSTMATISPSSKTGYCTGMPGAPSRSRKLATAARKLAPGRSHLFTNAMAGTRWRVIWRQTVSDWACTPTTASSTKIAPSSTRMQRSTSTVKSTWPGVSIRFSSWPSQGRRVAAEVMVMPRSRSSVIQSMTLVPSSTAPTRCSIPACTNMRSETVVLPASMWAAMPKLRSLEKSIRPNQR